MDTSAAPPLGWKQLERDISEWLRGLVVPGIAYRGPNQAIPGFPSDGFRSDGLLTDGRTLVAVEIEAGQMHPDTNVGKYWLLQDVAGPDAYERIVLIHVYTPDFNSYGWRKRLGEFYVEKMIGLAPVEYVQMDMRDASDYGAALAAVKQTVTSLAEVAFPDILAGERMNTKSGQVGG